MTKFLVHLSIKGLLTKLQVIEEATHKAVKGAKIHSISYVTDPEYGTATSFELELPVDIKQENLEEIVYD